MNPLYLKVKLKTSATKRSTLFLSAIVVVVADKVHSKSFSETLNGCLLSTSL